MSDFHYQCSKPLYSSGGDFYTAHFWLGILFVLLYPIGIPTLCGTVIFLHRADIKDGAGPSAFKRLYEDYKPDHCLCVATANSHHNVTFQRICTHAAVVGFIPDCRHSFVPARLGTGGRSISFCRRSCFAVSSASSNGARSRRHPSASWSPKPCSWRSCGAHPSCLPQIMHTMTFSLNIAPASCCLTHNDTGVLRVGRCRTTTSGPTCSPSRPS